MLNELMMNKKKTVVKIIVLTMVAFPLFLVLSTVSPTIGLNIGSVFTAVFMTGLVVGFGVLVPFLGEFPKLSNH